METHAKCAVTCMGSQPLQNFLSLNRMSDLVFCRRAGSCEESSRMGKVREPSWDNA